MILPLSAGPRQAERLAKEHLIKEAARPWGAETLHAEDSEVTDVCTQHRPLGQETHENGTPTPSQDGKKGHPEGSPSDADPASMRLCTPISLFTLRGQKQWASRGSLAEPHWALLPGWLRVGEMAENCTLKQYNSVSELTKTGWS